MEDYYQALGVDRGASADEIKKAYHRLAHKHHPDKEGGDEEKFKKINAAYQVLKDPQKKSQYDQFGQTFEGAQGAGPFGGFSNGGYNFNFDDLGGLGSIFDEFFTGGGRTRTRRAERGADISVDVSISFVESATGIKRDLSLSLLSTCEHCRGSGAEPGTPIETCANCQGRGVIEKASQTMFGVFKQSFVCPSCQGEGKKPKKNCSACRGQGRRLMNKTLTVDIPAGIKDGQSIRVSGQGEAPRRGGMSGDLYVNIRVQLHKVLKRDGNNVRSDINIPFVDAALGASVEIETLGGKKNLDIPAGTQPNAELKLGDLGFVAAGGGRRGDHLVTVKVEIPRRLNRNQKELLEQFRQSRKKRLFF